MPTRPPPPGRAGVVGHERHLPPVGEPPPGPVDVAVSLLAHRAVWPTPRLAVLALDALGWIDGVPRRPYQLAGRYRLSGSRVGQVLARVREHARCSGAPTSLAEAVRLVEGARPDDAAGLLLVAGLVTTPRSVEAVHATAAFYARAGRAVPVYELTGSTAC